MKSVIVQGATVAKAIDEALTKAGMPQEFFIKVLEEAQPGFLGFGSKKAKIALFFKKDDGRRDSSMLSRGTYKDLFDNPQLQAQPAAPEKQDKVEKKETPVQQQPQRKVEVQPRKEQAPVQQHPRKVEAPQPRKAEVPVQQHPRKAETVPVRDIQPRKVDATSIQHPQQKKPIAPQQQRPQLQQRPLKSLQPQQPVQDKPQAAVGVMLDKQPMVAQNKAAESVPSNNVQSESENRRPRRRRHYGYRSKAPVQWGKSQDEQSDQSNNDERHDSEPS